MERDQHQSRCSQFFKNLKIWEVIVITTIVVIMAVIFYPVFARTHCGNPICQNNIKYYAIAFQLYCEDNDDTLPSSNLVNHSKKWNRADFVKFSTTYGGIPVKEGERVQTLHQILSPHMEKHNSVFCDKDISGQTNPPSQVSYWYKLALDKAWYGEGCSSPCRKLSDFEHCADQIIFYEQKGFHYPVRAVLFTKRVSGLKNGIRINAAYLDTHVKSIELINCNKSADSKVWTTDPTAPGEPAYFNYEYGAEPVPPNVPTKYVDPHKYADRL